MRALFIVVLFATLATALALAETEIVVPLSDALALIDGLVVDRPASLNATETRAHATPEALARLAEAGIRYRKARSRQATGRRSVRSLAASYDTSSDLEADLFELAAVYSSTVSVHEIGRSALGKPLLVVKIEGVGDASERVGIRLIANIHGDEVVGRDLLRRFVRYAAEGEATGDARISALLSQVTLYVLVSLNPDGYDARTRENANGIDLNRIFPDQFRGLSKAQPETTAVMRWAQGLIKPVCERCALSLNLHGGALVAVYGYDGTAIGKSVYSRTPDDALFRYLSSVYAKAHPTMSKSRKFPSGTVNGAAWYALYGGLQDWLYKNQSEPHITVEVSDVKYPSASALDGFWMENRDSLLAYCELAANLGVRGRVTGTTETVELRIAELGAGAPATRIEGFYVRMLAPSVYTLVFSTKNGQEKRVSATVSGSEPTIVNVNF